MVHIYLRSTGTIACGADPDNHVNEHAPGDSYWLLGPEPRKKWVFFKHDTSRWAKMESRCPECSAIAEALIITQALTGE